MYINESANIQTANNSFYILTFLKKKEIQTKKTQLVDIENSRWEFRQQRAEPYITQNHNRI
jgi:glutathione synthase/RimK-type ligase-like ATP-grasp enzyme